MQLLKAGGVVVIPTDTLYGLAADAFSLPALERIFTIKNRPTEMSVPLLVSCWDHLELVTGYLPEAANKLVKRFWPGPLTLVLPKAKELPDWVTGGRDTVAVRMPNHQVALEIIRRLDRPVTGTSANRSGQQDLLDYNAIKAVLGQDVDHIVETGPPPQGTPSTVIDLTTNLPKLLRQGALSMNQILGEIG